jgi:hypothetical protein
MGQPLVYGLLDQVLSIQDVSRAEKELSCHVDSVSPDATGPVFECAIRGTGGFRSI